VTPGFVGSADLENGCAACSRRCDHQQKNIDPLEKSIEENVRLLRELAAAPTPTVSGVAVSRSLYRVVATAKRGVDATEARKDAMQKYLRQLFQTRDAALALVESVELYVAQHHLVIAVAREAHNELAGITDHCRQTRGG
jgi:hypothetical protein